VAHLDAPRQSVRASRERVGSIGMTVLEAPATPMPTTTLPATAPRRRSVAVRRERSDVDRLVTRALVVVAASVVGFLVFALALSGLAHDRSQAGLVRRFRNELATQRAPIGGVIPSGAPVALLSVPAIGVQEIVVQGTSSGVTRDGPGHLAASVLPGQTGNAVVAGRRVSYGGPFSRLSALQPGDRIRVTTGQGTARYTVIGSGTSPSDRVRMMMPTTRNRLTLVTSDPPLLANRYRYVVARLDSKPFPATGHASRVERVDLGLTGDPSITATLFVWLLFAALVGIGAVEAFRRLPAACAWLVAAPLVLVAAWLVYENFVVLLPATL
jgi:sortase A